MRIRNKKINSIMSLLLAFVMIFNSTDITFAQDVIETEISITDTSSGSAIQPELMEPEDESEPVVLTDGEVVPVGTEIIMYGNGDGGLLFDRTPVQRRDGTSVGITTTAINYGVISDEIVYSDGTPDFNTKSGAGYDMNGDNGIVRSFDTVTYQVDFTYNDINEEPSDIIIKASAPAGEFFWDTAILEKMGYVVNKIDDQNVEFIFNNVESGSGFSSLIPLYVGGEVNGIKFAPTFEISIVGESATPKNTLVPDTIAVSALVNVNLAFNSPITTSLGLEKANNTQYYLAYVGYELQLQPIPGNEGTSKGIQIPDPKVPITFTVNLSATDDSGKGDGKPYIFDYGLNGGSGELEGMSIITPTMFQYNHNMQYPIPSSKELSTNNKYVVDSGTMTVTQTNGSPLASDFGSRQYDSLKVSFVGFDGFSENSLANLRADGKIPFATGGIIMGVEAYSVPAPVNPGRYNLVYNASGVLNAPYPDSLDDVSAGTMAVLPEGRTLNPRSYYAGYTYDTAAGGGAFSTLGSVNAHTATSSASYNNVKNLAEMEDFLIVDPRAFKLINTEEFDGVYAKERYLNVVTYSTEYTSYRYAPSRDDLFGMPPADIKTVFGDPGIVWTTYYGVRNFTGYNMEYGKLPTTTVTSQAGKPEQASSEMDSLELELLSLNGQETDGKWFWTTDLDEALAKHDPANGWYACATRQIKNIRDADFYNDPDVKELNTQGSRYFEVLVNDYTKASAANYEPILSASTSFHRYDDNDDGALDREVVLSSNYFANQDSSRYSPYGFRKTTYDANGNIKDFQYPTRTTAGYSILLIAADPVISKTVEDANGNSFGRNGNIVPGIDTEVWWNLDVKVLSSFSITEDEPLIVTDTIPAGLILDPTSIYPSAGDVEGLTVEVVGDVITWTFTKGEANYSFNGLRYKTFVDPMTPSGVTFTEKATAFFFKEAVSSAQINTVINTTLSLYKEVDKAIINPDDSVVYTLNFRNDADEARDFELYDVFPYSRDKRGSDFAGTLTLAKDPTSTVPGVAYKYSFDKGLTATTVRDATFKTKAEWLAEGKDIAEATALYAKLDNLQPDVSHNVKLSFDTNSNDPADVLYNDFLVSYILDNSVADPVILQIKSNIVRSVVPGINKSAAVSEDSNFTDELYIDGTEPFVYKLDVFIPSVGTNQEVNKVFIKDKLDSSIEYLGGRLIDEKGNDVTSYFGKLTFIEADNYVEFEFEENLNEVPGKIYTLVLDVKLVDNYDLSGYKNEKVPNVATLDIDGTETESEEVTVAPRSLSIEKFVGPTEDANDAYLSIEPLTPYFYNLDVKIESIGGYEEIVITDTLEDEVEYLSGKVIDENGKDVTSTYGKLTFVKSTNKVTFKFNETGLNSGIGKYTIILEVQLKAGTVEMIPNVASITGTVVDPENPETPVTETDETEEVNVLPPLEDPLTIFKYVDFDENANKDYLVTKGEELYYYNVDILIKAISRFESITVTDQLDDRINFISARVVDAEGNDVTTTYGTLTEVNNLVTFEFNSTGLASKKEAFTLIIEASVKDGVTNENIPNIGTVTGNIDVGTPVEDTITEESNEVIVVVPEEIKPTPEIPFIEKSVGKDIDSVFVNDLEIDPTKSFFYKIKVKFPDTEITTAKIKDQLESELEFLGAELIDENGNDVTSRFGRVTENNNYVEYSFEKNFDELSGESYTLVIEVKLVDGYDLSKYKNKELPNTAKISVNGGSNFSSNEVTITDPGDPLGPLDPVDPLLPVEPVDPLVPLEPVDPIEPIEPVDPLEPETVNPTDPRDPTNPTDSTDPTDPDYYGVDGNNLPFGTGQGEGEEFYNVDGDGTPFGTGKANPITGDNNLLSIVIASALILLMSSKRTRVKY